MRILVNEDRPIKKFIFYFYFILSKNNENKRENGSQKKNKRENEIWANLQNSIFISLYHKNSTQKLK